MGEHADGRHLLPGAQTGNGQQDTIVEVAERGQAGRSALLPLRGRRLLMQAGEQRQICCGERAYCRAVRRAEAIGRGVAIPGGPEDRAGPWTQQSRKVVSLDGTRVACLVQHGVQGRPGIGRPVHHWGGNPGHGNNANVIETAGREDPALLHRGRRHAKHPGPPPVYPLAPVRHPRSLPGLDARSATPARIDVDLLVAARRAGNRSDVRLVSRHIGSADSSVIVADTGLSPVVTAQQPVEQSWITVRNVHYLCPA
jgi:hypothetical protein